MNVIVCGHYRCGGVQAAFGRPTTGPLEGWIANVRTIRQAHAEALALRPDEGARAQPLAIHGWIYDLHDGLLRDLEVSVGPLE
ncbi:MAG: hypothetical protein A3G76_05255 [Acidobacteria bacterium RIFCSPLOWO2_12_FULL_65_11]|nr:MAG: hypothetical protein A3H95_07230 [Acidobacteria bacterium RIFCSPLOWO2_02_FULL_64_15]OFW34187.1 MAG: hypothetical protein A3G76_05255 [Acidobacteria bacterium RIFCSPLOWO2_12_FULL_65_11]